MMVKEVMESPYIMTIYNLYNHHHSHLFFPKKHGYRLRLCI